MEKYYIDFVNKESYDAGSKARIDVASVLEKAGYKAIILKRSFSSFKFVRFLMIMMEILSLSWKIKSGNEVFLQYPYYVSKSNFLYKFLLLKKINMVFLIHDLDKIRWSNIKDDDFVYFLHAKKIIVHTPNMKEYLIVKGVSPDKIDVLYFFDYLVETGCKIKSSFGNKIVFAGNLDKSAFVPLLKRVSELSQFQLLLYGRMRNIIDEENIKYKGMFQSNDLTELEGDWGLVWDGDSIDTCGGLIGEYLRYNSSHKISLYLASEKPLIIWAESSLKSFVEENKLGISVSSLREIPDKLLSITEKEKERMRENIHRFSQKVRNGEMLLSCLNRDNRR